MIDSILQDLKDLLSVDSTTGFDARHGLIGPGVLETHGYERTHRDALINTARLLCAIVERG